MATRHTGGEAEEDSDTDKSDQEDKLTGKEKKTVIRFLNSKAVRRVTGKKLYAPTKVKPLPADVHTASARKTSDTVQQPPLNGMSNRKQSHESQEQDDQQVFYRTSPSPGGQSHRPTNSTGTAQQRKPVISPQQQHAATVWSTISTQQRHPSYGDRLQHLQSMSYDHLQQVV